MEQDQKFETIVRDTFKQQRKIDAEEWQKDSDFFLELGILFSGNVFSFWTQYIIAIKYTEVRCPETLFVVRFMIWGL